MKFTLGFSTCPNDTFMFDAMVHHKVDTEGLDFEVFMGDVEELNRQAFSTNIDITKLSFHAYAYVSGMYQLLDSGSALGYKNGPLVIGRKSYLLNEIDGLNIAIPGKHTTANLLFRNKFPNAKNVKEYVFSDIEDAVLSGEADAGVIIHENRFTYEGKGLKKIIDLGEDWEENTGKAIPLGGIVIKRGLPLQIKRTVERVLRKSVEFAFQNQEESKDFIKKHAQELDEEVIRKHIELYVNSFSISLGEQGRGAIEILFEKAVENGVIKRMPDNIFIT